MYHELDEARQKESRKIELFGKIKQLNLRRFDDENQLVAELAKVRKVIGEFNRDYVKIRQNEGDARIRNPVRYKDAPVEAAIVAAGAPDKKINFVLREDAVTHRLTLESLNADGMMIIEKIELAQADGEME